MKGARDKSVSGKSIYEMSNVEQAWVPICVFTAFLRPHGHETPPYLIAKSRLRQLRHLEHCLGSGRLWPISKVRAEEERAPTL